MKVAHAVCTYIIAFPNCSNVLCIEALPLNLTNLELKHTV